MNTKKRKKLTAVSLFTGAGGLDLGIESAGFKVKLCVEIDEDCQATLEKNRPKWQLSEPASIYELSGAAIRRQSGLKPRELTLLTGGPPCQPFSKAGYWFNGDSKRLEDPRANTLSAFMRVVNALLPECILLENVKGLSYEGKDEGLQLLKTELKVINERHGVKYEPNVIILNAADYGVPQLRERVFVIAHRKGKTFSKPQATHCSHQDCDRSKCRLSRYTTAWDAIGHLSNVEVSQELQMSGKWAQLLPSIPEGNNYLWHTPKSGGAPLFGWRTRFWSFLLKLAKNAPSWTIQAAPGPSTGPFHWKNRELTNEELCRLQTFPENYLICGNRRSAYRQIGNAVPAAIGELLGLEIRRQLLDEDLEVTLSLIPHQRRRCPSPELVQKVPRKYYKLRGSLDDHPGTGLGPAAVQRKRGKDVKSKTRSSKL